MSANQEYFMAITSNTSKRTTQASVNITEQELLRLQTKLTEIISRISIPNPQDDITFLEQEYEKLLVQIRKM